MKVADYIIKTLAEHGIDTVFEVYGGAVGDLIDAFTRTERIRYVAAISEQGASFMAEGWAKVSGRTGCVIATSGPGGGNLVTGIQNAYYDSVPMIFLTGQVGQAFMSPHPSIRQVGFQETPIAEIVRPITKYAVMVKDPKSIRYHLEKALYLAIAGRPGPVLIDLPTDVQKAEVDPYAIEHLDILAEGMVPKGGFEAIDAAIRSFLEDLARSERPAILVGGGVRLAGAAELCRKVCETLKVPCFPTWNAVDVITDDFPWFCGRVGTYGGNGRNFGIQNSDLLLALGSRISGRITGGAPETFARAARKYFVDIDPGLMTPEFQTVKADVNLCADVRLFLLRLGVVLGKEAVKSFAGWTKLCVGWRDRYDPVTASRAEPDGADHYAFVRTLGQRVPADAVIVSDSGGNQVTAMHAFETKWGQRQFSSNGNSPIGFSFCASIGAWFAAPERPIICLIGDGGMQANIQELQTVKNYGAQLKVFLLNNHVYGITRAFQETNFGGRSEACAAPSYTVPDFRKVVMAYGIATDEFPGEDWGFSVETVIDDAMSFPEAVLVDVVSHDFHAYYPKVSGWATPIEQMEPLLPRDEFEANMIVTPVDGWKVKK